MHKIDYIDDLVDLAPQEWEDNYNYYGVTKGIMTAFVCALAGNYYKVDQHEAVKTLLQVLELYPRYYGCDYNTTVVLDRLTTKLKTSSCDALDDQTVRQDIYRLIAYAL